MDYIGQELDLFSNAKNWKQYWSHKIKPICKGKVLEVGAGIGSNLSLLISDSADSWLALEPDEQQAEKIKQNINENSYKDKVSIVCGKLSDIEDSELFDTIIYIDVLEHIEHDQLEFENAIRHLKPKGKLVVLAPAHNSLYSPLDEAVGHFRRYDKASLKSLKTEQADISQIYYLDSVGCFASGVNAKFLKAEMPSIKQLMFWDRMIIPVSKIVDKFLFYKIGKTIVSVWEKK